MISPQTVKPPNSGNGSSPLHFQSCPVRQIDSSAPISGCSSGVDAQAIILFCSHCKGLISYSKEQTSLPDRKYRCPQIHQPVEIKMKFPVPQKTRRKARKGIVSGIRTRQVRHNQSNPACGSASLGWPSPSKSRFDVACMRHLRGKPCQAGQL